MLHRLLRPFSFRLFLTFAAAAAMVPATASAKQVFTVRDVTVDARAADELAAKSAGIANAQRTALVSLLQRMTLRDDHDRLPDVTPAVLAQLVSDYSVDTEKFGGGHYLATLTVRFKPDGVRNLLSAAEIPFAETVSRPVLVLPVFQTAGATSLWDEPNPWFSAWSQMKLPHGLLPLAMPTGDLSDVAVIGAEQAVLGKRDSIAKIAAKYDARGALVAAATLRVSPGSGALSLVVASSIYGGDDNVQTKVRKFEAAPGESRDALLQDAARALAEEAVETWKRDNLLDRASQQRMLVRIPLRGLDDWLKIRRRLEDIAGVKKADVSRLSIDRAEVDLLYIGNPGQLQLAMAQSGLTLHYAPETAAWVLTIAEKR